MLPCTISAVRIVVKDHVHPRKATGRGILLLPVERNIGGGFVTDLEQQGAGAASAGS